MRFLANSLFLAAALLTFGGCSTDSSGVPGAPVATTEDEFEAYDRMISQSEAEQEEENEAGQ
tara:strand:- start:31116 stop:31301 length:186 start_codon:yes stop_codon:yes gene_type:complete